MTIYEAIEGLCAYGVQHQLIEAEDKLYCRNQLLALMHTNTFETCEVKSTNHFECLAVLIEEAHNKGLIESSTPPYSDLFESKLMDVLMPKPSEVIKTFQKKMNISPQKATNYFYDLSKNSHYIRQDRTSKNEYWKVSSRYGDIDISINLSKPEKDPKAIAAALTQVENNYPKCLLCVENEGYSGHVSHPGRQNHRIIPLTLSDETWYFQYSPYAYFNEHSIVLKSQHDSMTITSKTFERLLEFLEMMPHYFIGSNADLPLVGGSLLTHDHYQAGRYTFAMERAKALKIYDIKGVSVARVNWPLTVLRICHEDKSVVLDMATKIFELWKTYDDDAYDVVSFTHERHNTVTPIARMKDGTFEMDLVLRNNRCDDQRPTGIFHPQPDVHPVKKENIGLIEVMGLAILPSRLATEITLITKALISNQSFEGDLKKFDHLFENFHVKETYEEVLKDVREKIGQTFVKGLEDAGVYSLDKIGEIGLERFINILKRA